MAVTFYIPRADKVIRKNSLRVWLGIIFNGRIKLGTFGGCEYFAFMCKAHGLRVDLIHGYIEGCYYHKCDVEGCKTRYLL